MRACGDFFRRTEHLRRSGTEEGGFRRDIRLNSFGKVYRRPTEDWNLLNECRKARESLLEGHNKTVSCVQIWSTFEWSLHYDFSFVSECRCKRSIGMAMEVTSKAPKDLGGCGV